ncbi:Ribokinase [[Clostridium] ultunense Esp]|nr:Ribokinase [[Clostridium] ultunense Esp]
MKSVPMSDKRILVIGAAVIDIVVHVDKLPKTGEDIYGRLEQMIVGGCAYNVQQVIQHFGLQHTMFVPIGVGPYSDIIRDELRKRNIPIVVEDDTEDNGWNISFVEKGGERTFLSIPGIETNWKKDWFEKIDVRDYDFIYLSGYELEAAGEVLIEQVIRKKSPDAKVVFDPGPRVSFIKEIILNDLLQSGTIVHCNQDELEVLIPNKPLEEAMKTLQKITGEVVVVTLGEKGCYYLEDGNLGVVPAKRVDVVDTIGAGDSHTGAFISGIASGLGVEAACELANEVSATVVQKTGGTFDGFVHL